MRNRKVNRVKKKICRSEKIKVIEDTDRSNVNLIK